LSDGFDDIDAGLTAIFDFRKRAGAEASESSEGRLCVAKLHAHHLDAEAHALARRYANLTVWLAYPIAQPGCGDAERYCQPSDCADGGHTLAIFYLTHEGLVATDSLYHGLACKPRRLARLANPTR